MYVDPNGLDRINSFALVTYIPEPVAGFLDRLRQELVPNCFLRAHITVLPPRPITCQPEDAWQQLRALAPHFPPLEVEMGEVQIFPVSDVIYVGLEAGCDQLVQMHDVLNQGCLWYQEPYPYHPHITLAQDLKPDELDELICVARERWNECCFPKRFLADKVVFVQNTRRKEWLDLGECVLGHDESHLVAELQLVAP